MRLFAVLLLLILAFPVSRAEAKITPQLRSSLENLKPGEKVSVIVELADQVDLDRFRGKARNIRKLSAESRREHRQDLVRALQEKAALTQGPLKNFLQTKGARDIETLWIVNALEVKAGRELIESLSGRPEVAEVRLNELLQLPTYTVSPAAAPEWNLSAINAPGLWDLGVTGQGVVVATLDSGVDLAHADLGSKWRGGTNSWFDPYGEHPSLPYDADGHGTAVAGILVGGSAGGTAIGVAPGARWIAAKIFNDADVAETFRIHQSFQWLLNPDGDPATDDAPEVVNNSWGFQDRPGECLPEFQPDVQSLRAAGIAVVFAAGNSGSLANTSVSPGNYPESFAVGAVDQSMTVPLFSARGPSACDGTIYPEVVAPGVFIRTAALTLGGIFSTSTVQVSGTSFAAPHVAGAMALLLSALPGQPAVNLEAAIAQTATDLGTAGPDNTSGSGLVNALAAYNFLNVPAPVPRIAVLPSATFFGFGSVPVNSSSAQTFTVSNTGTADLLLGSIALSGPDVAEFSRQNDLCSDRVLAPSASCSFDVVFSPLTPEQKAAAVAVPSNDPETPLVNVLLAGNDLVRAGTYRQGMWFLDNGSGSWTPATDTVYQNFGAQNDIPVAGDWDGDGQTEVGTYRQGMWFLDDGGGSWTPATDTVYQNFGAPDDIPVTGDWDGDGKTEVGTYRQGMWFLDNGNGAWDPGVDTVVGNFGAPTDRPVTGDVDGDRRSEIGVYRPSTGQWFFDVDHSLSWSGCQLDLCLEQFGAPDDIPVTGDWNGDGRSEVGTYRQGMWFLDNGNGVWDAGVDTVFQNFGAADDLPVTGNWR